MPVIEALETRWLFADGILPHPGPAVQGLVGVALSNVPVATFEIADPTGSPGTKWNAHIFWGDGHEDLRVPSVALPDGTFEFVGSHTYASAGQFGITVQIAVPGSQLPMDNVVTTTATVVPTIAGTPGDDQFYIRLSPDQSTLQVWAGTAPVGAPAANFAMSALTTCLISTGDGNDTVTVDFGNGSPVPAGGMRFDGGSGTNTLIVKGTVGNDTFTATGSGVSLGGSTVSYANVAQIDFDGGTGSDSLAVSSGTVNLGSLSNMALSVSGTGVADLLNSNVVSSLSIASGGQARLASGGTKALTIGPNATAASLDIAAGGILDIANNGLILQAGNKTDRDALLAKATALLASARGVDGMWAGTTGIMSSTAKAEAAANPTGILTGVPITPNVKYDQNSQEIPGSALKNTFKGHPVDGNAVIAAYSLNGDSNLDGRITFDDYFQINTGFLSNGALGGYRWGDVNMDGVINFNDYFLLNTAFLGQSAHAPIPPMSVAVAPFSARPVSLPRASRGEHIGSSRRTSPHRQHRHLRSAIG